MTNSSVNKVRDYLELSKLKIMIPVCLTGFTGYFAFNPHFSAGLIFTSLGILFMAVSASVLNQIQEVETDKKMNRTRFRPLPAQKINTKNAVLFFLINLITGILLLFFEGNIKAVIVGLITILWYNGVYTYSKRITAFAVVPGAITGALPPLIGWMAAGGGLWDKPIIFIEFLIFTAQIPHFWLLVLKYGEEYRQAGIPNLTDFFSRVQISRLTFSWVISSVFAALFLCYFKIIQSPLIISILVIASLYILWQFFDLLKMHHDKKPKSYSILFDSYFLLVLLLLISDKIIS